MNKQICKNLLITTSFCCFIACFMVLPTVFGYGSGFGDAEVITNGTHSNISYPSGDVNAYFKIYCTKNNDLHVTLSNFGYPTFDLDLYLYNPFQDQVDYSTNIASSESCSETTGVKGYFFIRVKKSDCCGASLGTTQFTLTISGASGSPGIPVFGILQVILGLLGAISILLLLDKKKLVSSSH